MKQYLDLVRHVMATGVQKTDRTGTGTRSVFGYQMRFNLAEGLPLVTTKKTHERSVIHELLWFLMGDTNVKYLQDHGVKIWDGWRRPYVGFTDEVIRIPRLKKEYVPFNGTFPIKLPYFEDAQDKKLAYAWQKLMRRCYDPTAHNYKSYGGKGTSVAERWHDVRNFVVDVKQLTNWFYKQQRWTDFELDKDYYGANQYCPEGCVWLHRNENVHHAWVRIVTGDGSQHVCRTYRDAAALTGLSKSSIHRFVEGGIGSMLKGKNRIRGVKNWAMQKASGEDYLYRNKIADDDDLGPVYGAQWRSWPAPDGSYIDQMVRVVNDLKNTPDSRRIIVSAWNVGELDKMALAPCHAFFQFYVADGKLSCQLYQRSCDVFLGLPFNIASYAMLTHMLAQQCDLEVGEFIWTGGDVHIYNNHFTQVEELLQREPKALPRLHFKRRPESLFDYKFEDFVITGYDPHPPIKAPVAV